MYQLTGAPPGASAAWMALLPEKYQFGFTPVAFIYGTDFVPLGASTTVTNSITIQDDAHFVILSATGTVFDSPAQTTQVTTIPQLVQIGDSASGANFFNVAQHYSNVVGTAQNPCYWQMPRLVRRGATMTVTLQNLDATARVVRLAFWGAKLYNTGQVQD